MTDERTTDAVGVWRDRRGTFSAGCACAAIGEHLPTRAAWELWLTQHVAVEHPADLPDLIDALRGDDRTALEVQRPGSLAARAVFLYVFGAPDSAFETMMSRMLAPEPRREGAV